MSTVFHHHIFIAGKSLLPAKTVQSAGLKKGRVVFKQFIVFKGTNFLVQMINLLISLVLVLVDGV